MLMMLVMMFSEIFMEANGIDNTNDVLTPASGSIDAIEGNVGGKEGYGTCTSSPYIVTWRITRWIRLTSGSYGYNTF